MSTLPFLTQHPVDRLLAEQQRVLEAFDAARDAGISTPDGLRRLHSVRQLLSDHLAVCDRLIYPHLRQLARTNELVKSVLARTDHGTEVSESVHEFFAKHGYAEGEDFFSDWGRVYIAVQKRFRQERTTLYPQLRKSKRVDELHLPRAAALETGPVESASNVPRPKRISES